MFLHGWTSSRLLCRALILFVQCAMSIASISPKFEWNKQTTYIQQPPYSTGYVDRNDWWQRATHGARANRHRRKQMIRLLCIRFLLKSYAMQHCSIFGEIKHMDHEVINPWYLWSVDGSKPIDTHTHKQWSEKRSFYISMRMESMCLSCVSLSGLSAGSGWMCWILIAEVATDLIGKRFAWCLRVCLKFVCVCCVCYST